MLQALLVAAIAAFANVIASIVAHFKSKKALHEIHVLVNDRMSSALDKISNLERRLGVPHSESDEKAAERKAQVAVEKPLVDELNRPGSK